MLAWLPSLTDLVIYGAMASAAGAIYIISFMGIVGSFYRWALAQPRGRVRWCHLCCDTEYALGGE